MKLVRAEAEAEWPFLVITDLAHVSMIDQTARGQQEATSYLPEPGVLGLTSPLQLPAESQF